MGRFLRKHKAYDQRTGRLERALDLIEDGDARGLKVHKREADPEHPLRRPLKIGPDRANLFPGLLGERTYEDAQFKYFFGYTLGANLWEQRSIPAMSWGSGGCILSATVVGEESGPTGDGILLTDGVSFLLTVSGTGNFIILS